MRSLRTWLAGAYALVALGVFFAPWSPRVFWTMLMPIVPIGIVLIGFHRWRRLCPIATLGAIATKRKRQSRVPTWLARHGLVLSFGVLTVSLALRLVATNGSPTALGVFLVGMPLAALVFNARFGGRSFCHYLCPIGVVERIYTDAAPPVADPSARAESSACAPCTGCVRRCPDVNRDLAYERDLGRRGRRLVFYAFPGLVFAFYFYYFLRAGHWEAYFDGRWTDAPLAWVNVLGPGFFFAPQVPAIAAASLTLVVCAGASYVCFCGIERALGQGEPQSAERRHRMLALASFAAFNIFYFFAGAPSLRLVPGLSRIVAFVVPVVATLVLGHRLLKQRRPERRLRVVS